MKVPHSWTLVASLAFSELSAQALPGGGLSHCLQGALLICQGTRQGTLPAVTHLSP